MNVALVTSYWKNKEAGGAKNYLANLLDALKKRRRCPRAFLDGACGGKQFLNRSSLIE